MQFFDQPILNSPYYPPTRHWELDSGGRPTDQILESRRRSDLISAMPAAKTASAEQMAMTLEAVQGLSSEDVEYNPTPFINELRSEVDTWRALPNPSQWKVSPVTQRLLQHWRTLQADDTRPIRPFFCQVEAAEVAIWLAEVAPKMGKRGRRFLEWLGTANDAANPDLFRIALKLATGAGKTTVMAMLIAWQTLNAVRSPNAKAFGKGFLIVTPGITIRDRLRVLMPSEADNYYRRMNLVPSDMMSEMGKAKIVITNYHAFKLKDQFSLTKGTRAALEGHGAELQTEETEGEMLRRVMGELLSVGPITVINDEAHHCYRERPTKSEENRRLTSDEKKEAEENREAARLWISGIEAANRHVGVRTVYDLSATPFFLSGSGWVEGTLFPWVASDFSLMDAIECGIVKLPRVPVADNVPGRPEPLYRNLWPTIRTKMPRKQRGESKPDPLKLPLELQTAIDALYGHYEKTYREWQDAEVGIPPVFIVVCNNTTNSELVRDYIAGFQRESESGSNETVPGRCKLFSNFDAQGNRLARPRTILIDSEALEAGGDIDKAFRDAHADEITAFRREMATRGQGSEQIDEATLLREVMNTVGKEGRLGEQVRCVVSVSMLTEGWDANNVTHILGLRAFGTRLICEQVVGRALRRMSYDPAPEPDPVTGHKLFRPEYADIMGIDGLNFSDQPRPAPPQKPRQVVQVRAMSPERDHLEISFPRVEGYRAELPDERLEVDFSRLEPYVLTPEKAGASEVVMQGIVGEPAHITLEHLGKVRDATIAAKIAMYMVTHKLRDANESPKMHLFPRAKQIIREWLVSDKIVLKHTYKAQLLYKQIADEICSLILGAIRFGQDGDPILRAVLDPYTPTGSTHDVNFNTSKATRYWPRPDRSHINWIVTDSDWEAKLARLIEDHPKVAAYAKNHNLGFEVPYLVEGEPRRYLPDFLVRLGAPEPVTLVLEVKGFRGHDAMLKAQTMRNKWIPAVNRLGTYGRWAFDELRDPYAFGEELDRTICATIKEEASV